MIADKIENTLNGGYAGLYGEVVTEDIYRLKSLKFIPEIIFDLGANVGIFTRFARSLFPSATIIAVEPDANNFLNLVSFTDPRGIVFINKAIGTGQMFRVSGAVNGAHESYVDRDIAIQIENVKTSFVESIMLDEIVSMYAIPSKAKTMLKMDIEGNEASIWDHAASMEAMRRMDYIAMETHWWEKQKTKEALLSFEETHDFEIGKYSFYATKKIRHGN